MPDARTDRHPTVITFEPYTAGHLIYMAQWVELPDGTHPTEEYAEQFEFHGTGGETYTMLEHGRPISCFGLVDHGQGTAEAWAILTPRARHFPLALTRGVSRRILPAQQRLNLKLIFSKVRKEEPRWNWWLQALRVPMPDGTVKSFEITDILKQDEREYILYVMRF